SGVVAVGAGGGGAATGLPHPASHKPSVPANKTITKPIRFMFQQCEKPPLFSTSTSPPPSLLKQCKFYPVPIRKGPRANARQCETPFPQASRSPPLDKGPLANLALSRHRASLRSAG